MRLPLWATGLALLFVLGCQKKPEAAAEHEEEESAEEEESDAHAKKKGEDADAAAPEPKAEPLPKKFAVPFAWQASDDEPLARTRAFMQDVVRDNEANVRRGAKFFAAFAEKQMPRATVISCSDSRMQTQAWDATPENDDFQIRNIGNQLKNNEGSVEYGVEHLHTPLLFIVGHTGCGAVKAAMGDTSALSEPIRRELAALTLPAALKTESATDAVWAEAVVANVHSQVETAVAHFNKEVGEQQLTVVGAVYDFRGDLGDPGTLHLVNVNANVDPERLAAFTRAIGGRVRNELGTDDPTEGLLARVAEAARALTAAEPEAAHGAHATPKKSETHGAGHAREKHEGVSAKAEPAEKAEPKAEEKPKAEPSKVAPKAVAGH